MSLLSHCIGLLVCGHFLSIEMRNIKSEIKRMPNFAIMQLYTWYFLKHSGACKKVLYWERLCFSRFLEHLATNAHKALYVHPS